jgi:sugar/nucleoside kinase (ribokinase family)
VSVAVVGNLSVDRVADGPPRAGGPVYYAALAATRLDADVRIATRCAVADVSVVLGPLDRTGIPVAWQPSDATTAFSFHYDGERRTMHVDAVGHAWLPGDVTGWVAHTLDGADWVHVGALLRSDFPAVTLEALAQGRRLLVDAQGLVRRAQCGPLVRDGDLDRGCLASIQALKLSENEASMLVGGTDAASLRTLGVPEVILTLGSAGSVVVTRDAVKRVNVEPVAVSDPTGAGDTYAIGYAVARAAGAEPVAAARRASALVADVLAARG